MTSSNALGQVRSKCEKVIQWFDTLKIKYTRVDLFAIPEKRAEMEQLSGKKELPQVFIGKKLFGGFDVIESMVCCVLIL